MDCMRRIYRKIRDHEMPLGLKLILGFYLFSIVQNTWRFFMEPSIIFLGKVYDGTTASWISFIFLLYEIAWVIAIIKRLKWGWKLFVGWTFLSTPIAFPSFVELISHSGRIAPLIIGIYIGSLALLVITTAYVYQKRNYFNK